MLNKLKKGLSIGIDKLYNVFRIASFCDHYFFMDHTFLLQNEKEMLKWRGIGGGHENDAGYRYSRIVNGAPEYAERRTRLSYYP